MNNYISQTVWMKRFLTGQRYSLNRIVFYQDDQSVMKLKKDGFRSRREKSRHINLHYFNQGHTKEREDWVKTFL